METGKFYYIKDEYYEKFKGCGLMENKGENHNRPCYYCFEEGGIYWLIPISHNVSKYKNIYEKNSKKYKDYFGITFGYVNGNERAFLIQNMCPVTLEFIDNVYKIGGVDVTINSDTGKEVIKNAHNALALYKKGIKITFTNLDKILKGLI